MPVCPQYFTPYFYYIPKASLAAVIIAAVVFMMELHVFKPIWRTKSQYLFYLDVTEYVTNAAHTTSSFVMYQQSWT